MPKDGKPNTMAVFSPVWRMRPKERPWWCFKRTRMPVRAAELGCKGTHFVNPHGLHDPDHYTTAYDISLYMTEALKHELFRTIIHTATYVLPATAHQGEQTFYNTNALISNFHYSGYVYDKCIGGKTGTTDEAGKCLVAAAESGDTLLISVILGSGVVDPNARASSPRAPSC